MCYVLFQKIELFSTTCPMVLQRGLLDAWLKADADNRNQFS